MNQRANKAFAVIFIRTAGQMLSLLSVCHCRSCRANSLPTRWKYSRHTLMHISALKFQAFYVHLEGPVTGFCEHGNKYSGCIKEGVFVMEDLRFSQRWLWRVSSGIWRRVVRWVSTDVSEEHIASIFKVEEIGSANQRTSRFATYLLAGLLNIFHRPWRWRRYVPPIRRLKLNGLHGVISQKMILFGYLLALKDSVWGRSLLLCVVFFAIILTCINFSYR
jgi:hypothetical protein